MKAFLIHSFGDKEKIDTFIDRIKKYKKLEILKLDQSHWLIWRILSLYSIIKSDFIIVIVGEYSHQSKNISWELKIAQKANKKIYVIKLDESFNLPNEIDDMKIITDDELKSIIEIELDINKKIEKNLFNDKESLKNDIESQKLLLEEYKLLLQTSESLILRRQAMNTFFLTANGVLISMLGIITGAKVESSYLYIYYCAFSLVGGILCLSWNSLLVSYGQLNAGKFEVLNRLEQFLPVSIFKAEWIALGEGKNKKKYRSFTQSEKIIPRLFLILYIIIFITVIIFKVTLVKEFIKFLLLKIL
ncbi:RipA family octameric membrane protein [Clostridium chromiireducens]|uniref:Thoeris protein ThsB TIR-like domain-containing protein n=1 Tax=Clostridium chromiireducens TaxID=225345 RepID=A0A1V4IBV5_9CLOT|nr:TIR domain-containing protein [Clostridium chromiireducens]OPJ57360.1 hypothetical protein CLCHR_44580 [Clostridium chromiireducens]